MTREEHILEETEKTLRAFDHLPKLEANPFLFTRLQAALAKEEACRDDGVVQRLHLRRVALGIVIILNLVTVLHLLDGSSTPLTKEDLVSALRQEYHVSQSPF